LEKHGRKRAEAKGNSAVLWAWGDDFGVERKILLDYGTRGAKVTLAVGKRQFVNKNVLSINPPFAMFTPQQ
jgi:hypothetical protein